MHSPFKTTTLLTVLTLTSVLCSSANAQTLNVSEARVQKHIDQLSKVGNLGPKLDDGFTRAAWSNEETRGMEYIKQEGEKIGLEARYDGIGNLFLRTRNNSNNVIQTGSHMDTVPSGGTFDGAVGIVSGLEAIKSLIDAQAIPADKDIELVLWRGEESATFQYAYKGSKAAWGDKMPTDLLKRKYNGITLEDAIRKQGFDPTFIRDNKPAYPVSESDKIKAYVELHIEQANKLETDRDVIGIVTSIRGGARYKVEVIGRFDHSGATPMGTTYRKDANLSISNMQVELDKLLYQHTEKGQDLVQTIGVLNSDAEINKAGGALLENAMTKVSGYGYFFLDIRSNHKKTRDDYASEALETLRSVAKKFNTSVKISSLGTGDPAESLDLHIENMIEAAAIKRGYKYQYMTSGAGHDAGIVAAARNSRGESIPVAMIFIPSKNGISHDREEFTQTSDIVKGSEVLADTLLRLLKQ
ncbi:MAG: Zn-dependent hydrolase [Betaproteobacteria bacterium]